VSGTPVTAPSSAPPIGEPRPPAAKKGVRGRKLVTLGVFVALMAALFFLPGGEKREFEVAGEFDLHPIVELPSIGPVDMSITKPVIYLWITVGIIVIMTIAISRTLKPVPGRFQEAMEALYELARDGIARSVMKTGADTWFPYIGGVFFFILISNVVGLIPLPFGEHHALSYYTATANLMVTATLALFTFVFTHYAGIKAHGLFKYMKTWAPPSAPPVLKQFIWFMHLVSEIFRLVSLSVRLFANMLAGHAILAVFFAMALIFQNYAAALILQGGSVAIYLFEIFVAFIQAFIFAILSGVYIGGALDQEH
jgi:F-type H+-transporting ATPase subunit a